jgi:glycosyltransferase involved in cell wall biosynthesis
VTVGRGAIAFYAGRGWESWDSGSPLRTGIGGSETCLVHLSRELARLGYDVSLFMETPSASEADGVRYYPHAAVSDFLDRDWEAFVHFRSGKALALPIRARLRLGFAQDLTLLAPPGPRALEGRVDYLLGLSEPHCRHLAAYHGLPPERILLTANAVDPARYEPAVERVRGRIFFSSCPSRDLDRLLWHSQELVRHVPGLEIVVAYGTQTWEGLIAQGRGDPLRLEVVRDMMRRFPWVRDAGRLDQEALARLQLSSSAWLYPTSFRETFCITAAEAGFAGCPILATANFGLLTTVGDGGILLSTDPDSPEFGQIFVAHAVRLLRDDRYREHWAGRARERMRRFTWTAVAAQWDRFLRTGEWTVIQ